MAHEFTTYTVTASFERDGQCLACNQAEVIGDAYGVTYTDRDEVQAAVDELTESLSDTDLDPSTTYGIDETTHTIEIGGLIGECPLADEILVDPESLSAYIHVHAKFDGRSITVSCMLGLRESDWGSARASGCGVTFGNGPHVWWEDRSDWSDVPKWAADELLDALRGSAKRLWSSVALERQSKA